MTIIFRTDASQQIGSGHVMRCLTLADELRQHGANIRFICREHPGNLISLIEDKEYLVIRLPQHENEIVEARQDIAHAAWLGVLWEHDATDVIAAVKNLKPNWLIVDHYAIDHRWEKELHPHVNKIMVIDDLADRHHDCDLLLDQNLYQSMNTRYDNLIPKTCQKLLGPPYALLRSEFTAARKNLRQRNGDIKRVLVSFGGVDPTNETAKALQALANATLPPLYIDVVVGGGNIHKKQIQNFCAAHNNFHYHCQINNMAELMTAADLAIGGGGSTTWERCLLGLPTITIVLANNQSEATIAVENAGATLNLGWHEDVTVSKIYMAVSYALANPVMLSEMSQNGLLLMGNTGVRDSSSVIKHILEG